MHCNPQGCRVGHDLVATDEQQKGNGYKVMEIWGIVCVCVCVYIYIYRERERERELLFSQ